MNSADSESHITEMRVAFVGNQDNNAYRLCRWIRRRDIDAHLYLFRSETPTRSMPEQVDVELAAGYPEWLRTYDDTSVIWPVKRGKVARRIDSEYDVVVTSGITGLLAAGHFKRTPVVHLSLGSEISEFPLWVWKRGLSLKWRAACYVMRRNLKRVAKIIWPEPRALEILGHRDKLVTWGFPEDPEDNRARVDHKQLDDLTARYADCDRVFIWLTRLNFVDTSSVEYKAVEKFLDAFERLVRDGKHAVKAIVGEHGYDVAAFKERVTAKGLDTHVDYVGHMPIHEMLTYMSIPDCVVVDVPNLECGYIIGGVVREAMSLGTPVVAAMDSDIILHCYGPDCPVIEAHDTQTCYEGMARVAAMNGGEFAQLRKSVDEWTDRYLHYDRRIDKFIKLLDETRDERNPET